MAAVVIDCSAAISTAEACTSLGVMSAVLCIFYDLNVSKLLKNKYHYQKIQLLFPMALYLGTLFCSIYPLLPFISAA